MPRSPRRSAPAARVGVRAPAAPPAEAPDWAAIRRRYEATDDPVDSICSEAGITRRDLDAARKRERWLRSKPRPFPPSRTARPAHAAPPTPEPPATPTRAVAPPEPDGAEDTRPGRPLTSAAGSPRTHMTPAARRRLLNRLANVISLKLEQLEKRMAQDLASPDTATATDHERETRAIGVLIDNLGKVTEMEAGLPNAASARTANAPAARAAAELADEAERRRSELAERLARLVRAAGGTC